MKKSQWLKYTLSFLLAGVLVYFAFRKVDWTAFWEGLRQTRWGFMGLYVIVAVAALLFRALRWQSILRPLDPSVSGLLVWDADNIGNLVNIVLPSAGEFTRCGIVSGKKASYDKVFGTVACERVCDTLAVFVIFFATFIIDADTFRTFFVDNIWQPLAGKLGGAVWWIGGGVVVLLAAAVFAIFRLRGTNRFCGKVAGVFTGLGEGFASIARMERKWTFVLYTILIWVMYFFMSYFVMKAVPATSPLPLAAALFITAVGNIASIIPVPGGVGAYHYLVALTIQGIYFLPWDTGILYATLNHESHAVLVLVLGLVSFVAWTLRKKRI